MFNSPVWHLISISDWISKYLILLGLFFLSVFCGAVVIYKFLAFRRQKNRMRQLLRLVRRSKSLSELASLSNEFAGSVGGVFLKESLGKLKGMLSDDASGLTVQQVEQLDLFMTQDIDALIMEEESYLPVLGTSSAVAPLIGLFGTIWGLIHAFISISQEKSADIAVIAPGIAAALLTTLAGLVVAIPAMIAFHYFSNGLRKFEVQLNDLQDLVLMMVKEQFLK